eukprot:jgi/Psemu1/1210/gm1.1210_g
MKIKKDHLCAKILMENSVVRDPTASPPPCYPCLKTWRVQIYCRHWIGWSLLSIIAWDATTESASVHVIIMHKLTPKFMDDNQFNQDWFLGPMKILKDPLDPPPENVDSKATWDNQSQDHARFTVYFPQTKRTLEIS